MTTAIDIIRLGPNNDLFQISDGVRYGLVEFNGSEPSDRQERMRRAHVQTYLQKWLDSHGALTGSQAPPRLDWIQVEMAVVAARAPEIRKMPAERMSKAQRLTVVMPADEAWRIDAWRLSQYEFFSRQEAIRKLIELGLMAAEEAEKRRAAKA